VPTPQPERDEVEILSVDSKITESNDYWGRHAWQLVLQSKADRPLRIQATIKFLDSEGFIIDQDDESNLLLPAGEFGTFSGYTLINQPGSAKVDRVQAEIGWR
jgi:hypothetical protein